MTASSRYGVSARATLRLNSCPAAATSLDLEGDPDPAAGAAAEARVTAVVVAPEEAATAALGGLAQVVRAVAVREVVVPMGSAEVRVAAPRVRPAGREPAAVALGGLAVWAHVTIGSKGDPAAVKSRDRHQLVKVEACPVADPDRARQRTVLGRDPGRWAARDQDP